MDRNLDLAKVVLIYLVIILMTLSIYLPVKSFEFVDYDDDMYVFENQRVQEGLTYNNLLWSLTATHASNWHPLTWISHMADVQLFGLKAGPHHLTSIAFHILNTILLLLWLHTMTGEFWKSSFVAALFALHPLHVESVAWIAERKDVLSTFFCFLSLLSYAHYCREKKHQYYLLSLLSFICGLLSKPMIVTLPFVFLLLDYWPLNRLPQRPENRNRILQPDKRVITNLLVEKIPFLIISFFSCWITITVQHKAIVPVEALPFLPRIANSLISYTEYLAKTVFPYPLAVLYPHPRTISLWKLSASLMVMLSITFLVISRIRKRPWLTVGWFWFIGTLVPVIGLVQVSILGYADRYSYIPLIGLSIMLAWQAPVMIHDMEHKNILLSLGAVCILSVLGILSSFQVKHWKNSITLFKHALNATSGSFVAHNNLGFALAKKGHYQEAIKHYHEAIRIFPGLGEAYSNLGFIAFKQGNYQEAILDFQNALSCNPESASFHYLLANSYFQLKQINVAAIHYAKALDIHPNYMEAMTNLAVCLSVLGKREESLALFKEAIRINPDFPDTRNKMAKLFPDIILPPHNVDNK